ncbi:DUF4328 domain-containing protein [Nakamurella leprariae]|uniref:DUF4328 domain-containing protein n=1 Tax=Nakamurella leprariae TaxID=2803911 RepID=A0A938YGM9_9ACTN|nr:DUF4328 domain-containing protein [Nakamurella leprariae]MBM9469161.1 DUF4328 domain-containing protein [Nakamurella leprariae]
MGPPSYGPDRPRWGYRPIAWVPVEPPARRDASAELDATVRPLRTVVWLGGLTAVFALLAAAAEIQRFVLLLRGRTEVLDASVVRFSDAAVVGTSVGVLLAAVLTVLTGVPAVVRLHAGAAAVLRRGAPHSRRAVLLRLLLPGWNLVGAGQVLAETESMVAGTVHRRHPYADAETGTGPDVLLTAGGRPRVSRLVAAWWVAWVLNGVLWAAAVLRGLGGSAQAAADSVELHIAVDVTAAVVAGLTAALAVRLARLVRPRRPPYAGWVVVPPAPTRG